MLRSNETNCTQLTNNTDIAQVRNSLNLMNSNKVNVAYITKRSIGIQLSRQSTPCLTSKNAKRKHKQSGTYDTCIIQNENSSASTSAAPTTVDGFPDELFGESGTDDGLEYDYYEPPHPPGSFLCSLQPTNRAERYNEFELISEIDIDEILQHEAKKIIQNPKIQKNMSYESQLNNVTLTQDAHTQISGSVENINILDKSTIV